jgi:hypothetical protein
MFTYTLHGINSNETLTPVRWDDGREEWQITNAGKLVGFLVASTRGDYHRGVYDRLGTFETCEATDKHRAILFSWEAVSGVVLYLQEAP